MTKSVWAYFNYIWKSNRVLILFSMIFIATVQVLLLYFNSTLDIAPIIKLLMSQMPPPFMEMFGEEILAQISVEGTIAFGLEHPLLITLITFIGISIVSGHMTTSSVNRMMEIILAHPFRRQHLLIVVYLFATGSILLLVLATFTGAWLSLELFYEPVEGIWIKMIKSDLNAFLLHQFIMSMALFFAVFMRDIGRAIRFSAIITLVFYFIDIMSNFYDSLDFTKYFNFFSYFEPQLIMFEYEHYLRDIMVLALGSMVLFLASLRIFLRKDIF